MAFKFLCWSRRAPGLFAREQGGVEVGVGNSEMYWTVDVSAAGVVGPKLDVLMSA